MSAPFSDLSTVRVLVVDDNEDVLTAIRLLLTGHVGAVQTATSPASLPTLMRENRFDVVLLDMNYERDASSGREGLEYLDRLLRMDADLAVIMITAYGRCRTGRPRDEAGRRRFRHQAVGQRAADRVGRRRCSGAPDPVGTSRRVDGARRHPLRPTIRLPI